MKVLQWDLAWGSLTIFKRFRRRFLAQNQGMQIHQLSISHDEVQDRWLVRLNTQDAQESRFWLIRRMPLRLLPSVLRLEAAQPGVAASDGLQTLSRLKH